MYLCFSITFSSLSFLKDVACSAARRQRSSYYVLKEEGGEWQVGSHIKASLQVLDEVWQRQPVGGGFQQHIHALKGRLAQLQAVVHLWSHSLDSRGDGGRETSFLRIIGAAFPATPECQTL